MSDIDVFMARCYDILLQQDANQNKAKTDADEELCACKHMIEDKKS